MKKQYEQFIQEILADFEKNNYLSASSIPHIDLYMDQVTTFMDDHLDIFKRKEEDKTLTKTMINNYSKCQLLPPTTRKKYSRDHMLLLLIIYYLKPTLSIPDIQAIIEPLQKILMKEHPNLSLEQYYETIVKQQSNRFGELSQEIMKTVELSKNLFSANPTQKSSSDDSDQELLSIIATIYTLSLQANLQKHLAAQLIDNYLTPILNSKEPKKDERKDEKIPDRVRREKPKKTKSAD